ncbi:MAG: ABC transporter permease [Treponema sp.]|jgi:ribose transport system permease protein|nr:ABC transporter permease [Treponema sp.]
MSSTKQGIGSLRAIHLNPVNLLVKYNTVLIFVLLIIISSIISNSFLTFKNISNLLRQNSGIAIVSMGMLLVILTGGIDLSVGSVVALGCVLAGYFLQTFPLAVALLFTMLVCMLSGIGAGYFVAFRKVAPFVVTLAFMTISRGIAFIISKGTPIRILNQSVIDFGRGTLLGLPCLAYIVLGVFIVFAIVLKFTVFGRLITAIGSNESAVRLSGITVPAYKFSVYIISAVVCSFAGAISASRAAVGSPIVGTGMELDAIASVVIGGASLSGGKGSIHNTLLGVFILGMIGNIMNLMNVAAYPQQVIKGVIILVAVLLQGAEENKEK